MTENKSKTYTFDEVLEASTKYFGGDELAGKVFAEKYALHDSKSGLYYELTPLDMHMRMAMELWRMEQKYPNPLRYDDILEYLADWVIVPQGSPMAGIGNPYQATSIGNCFVIKAPEDSYAGILRTDQEQAQLMKRRAGVGFDISTLRPRGSATNNTSKTSDGIGVFMERFSNTTREVAQGGRRGALMLTISVHHPDIRTFITIKQDTKKVTGANVSVRVTDEFMKAIEEDGELELRFPVEPGGKVYGSIKAREIWTLMMESAHKSGEPGVLFWDTVQKWTPADIYKHEGFASVSTNPCGEIVLSPFDSCRLLVLNALKFVKNPFGKKPEFDWAGFSKAAYVAQRLMDDIVDLELECIDKVIAKIEADPEQAFTKCYEHALWVECRRKAMLGRRTGTGLTAIGDTVAAMGMTYGNSDSIDFVEALYHDLAVHAYHASIDMAEDRGAFPVFDLAQEKDHPFLHRVLSELSPSVIKKYKKYGRRNIALTTTAPAGSVSILTQTTSGIEPAFLLKYDRWKKINPGDNAKPDRIDVVGDAWQKFTVYHPGLQKWMDVTGGTDPDKSPYHNATANDINWKDSVKVQAVAQKWICHAISKTCNLPKDVSVDTVSECYLQAWKLGCKGFTVYRDGSRDGVLTSGEVVKKAKETIQYHDAPKRPELLDCEIYRSNVAGDQWTIFLGLMDGKAYEIMGGLSKYIDLPKKTKTGFIRKNRKKGGNAYDFISLIDTEDEIVVKDLSAVFENPNYGAFSRTISLALRHGVPVQYVVEQLQKGDKDSDLFSFAKVMARVLKGKIKDGTKVSATCNECKSQDIEYREGCATCMSCGYSKCG